MNAQTSAPQVGESEFDPVKEALEAAAEALNGCYEVQSYPGDGSSWQDTALAKVRGCLESYRPSPDSGGVEAQAVAYATPQASAGDHAAFNEILKHVRAPRRESSERLDRIEAICVAAMAERGGVR